jgi:hypothetical protein
MAFAGDAMTCEALSLGAEKLRSASQAIRGSVWRICAQVEDVGGEFAEWLIGDCFHGNGWHFGSGNAAPEQGHQGIAIVRALQRRDLQCWSAAALAGEAMAPGALGDVEIVRRLRRKRNAQDHSECHPPHGKSLSHSSLPTKGVEVDLSQETSHFGCCGQIEPSIPGEIVAGSALNSGS